MNYKLRMQLVRLVNLVRPRPRLIPLTVNDLFADERTLDPILKFNDIYYKSGVTGELQWRGSPLLKNPCDLWVITELIQKIRPTAIVETGTHHGGSALYYSDMARLFDLPVRIITVDLNPKWAEDPAPRGIISLSGYSTDANVFRRVVAELEDVQKEQPGAVLVFLDSDHSKDNVLNELKLYASLVTPQSYVIVEDTNVNGHPSSPDFGPGPYEAVEEFLKSDNRFELDRTCERHLLTFNPRGWLKRIR